MNQTDPSRNIVAALSYLLGFITGVVILFVEKDDKFVRFHAMQSTVLFLSLFVINLVMGIIFEPLGLFALFGGIIENIIFIIFVIIWLISMIKAFKGQIFKWPIAGRIAESWVK